MFSIKYIIIYCVYIVTLLSLCSCTIQDDVDKIIAEVLKCHPNNPGLSLAIVQNGQVTMAKGYGVVDTVSRLPVTSDTLFGVASLSKAFAATLLMKQLKPNNLTIYSDLNDILGSHFEFSTSIRTSNADLRDLLSHSLGIPGHNYMRLDRNLTLRSLPSRMKYLESIYPFRSSFLYNNLMYGLVTDISEKLGGRHWEDLIQQNIYNPLGMTSSSFFTRANKTEREVAQGYTLDGDSNSLYPVPFDLNRYWGKLGGSGNVMSTANDMTKWMLFNLKGSKNPQAQHVLDPHNLASVYVPRNAIRSASIKKYFTKPGVPVTTSTDTYGFGWMNGFYRGYPILRHTGTTYGYASIITLIPSVDAGIFVSMTGVDSQHVLRNVLQNYLGDLVLGETPWLNATTVCTFPEPWYQKPVNTHHSISTNLPLHRSTSAYIGTYHNDAYGYLTVHQHSSNLTMQYGIGTWTLYPSKTADHFNGKAQGILKNIKDLYQVVFHNNGHSSTSVEIPSFESHDPPVFKKLSSTNPSLGSIFG